MSSSEKSIECGIPQGSVLGPFLFLLYVNDLSTTCSKSKVTMFADDTTVINAGKRTDTLVREDIKTMTRWFDSNKLTINAEKCEAIHFGRGRPEAIVIKDKTLDYKSSCKYLGLQIDPRLSFKDHIDQVVKKLNKFCGLIYHVRHLYPRKCLLMFYNSFAKSVITYGLLIYGSAAKTNLAKIDSAQRRILRAIFFKKKYDSMQEILSKNKINTIYELFIKEIVHEVFRELRKDSPLQLLNLEERLIFQRETRWNSKGLFQPIIARTLKNKKSLTNSLMIAYNWLKTLDLIPSQIETLSETQLKKHLNLINELYIVDNKDLFSLYY